MPDQKPDEVAIFAAAAELPEDAQAAFLNEACQGDRELRDRIARYLDCGEQDGPLDIGLPAIEATLQQTALPNRVGSQIGPYKLIEKIGEGGMGLVYMAEQKKPVRRTVALKVIKPGMDSQQVVARFESERQALALMNHPNIAKVLDAGTTDAGLPYFVMELVKGIPITEFCDQQRLDNRQRLDLFITVCRAVQHAHQKGVIHRDLKPSNVLVELHDVTAVPKVIDFGVAKATNQQLTERSLHTAFSQMIGTPLYMSPEQAQLSGLDVDTRSDVYSLGVLLYELLTGATPFAKETLRSVSYDEMRRIIREDEPCRPSERVSTLAAEAISTISAQRQIDPRSLSQSIRGEVDWVVMKALEKDRTRRYESASAFGTDVQRYLDGDVVEACPPSTVYRLGKLVRRHRITLSTISLIMVAILVGASIAIWQAARATDAERQAKRQQQRAEANLSLALNSLDQTYMPQGVVSSSAVDQQHIRKGLAFYEAFAKQNEASNEARWETGKAHHRVGQLHALLHQEEQAEKNYRRSLAVFDDLARQFPEEPIWRQNRAVLHEALGWRVAYQKRTDEAYEHFRTAVAISKSLVADFPEDLLHQAALARTRKSLSFISRNNSDERLELLRNALKFYDEVLPKAASTDVNQLFAEPDVRSLSFYHGEVTKNNEFQLARATIHTSLGHLHRKRSPDESELAYRQAAIIQQRLLAELPGSLSLQGRLSSSFQWMCSLLVQAGKNERSLAVHEEAVEVFSRFSDEHPDNADLRKRLVDHKLRLAAGYFANGKGDQANSEFTACLKLADPSFITRYLMALVAASIENDVEYRQLCNDMLSEFSATENMDAAFFTAWTCSLAPDAIDDYGPAITLARQAMRKKRDDPMTLMALAALLLRNGQYEEALKQLEAADRKSHTTTATRKYLLALTQFHLGNTRLSENLLTEANAHRDHKRDDTNTRSVWNRLLTLSLLRNEAEKLILANKPTEAEPAKTDPESEK